MSGDAGGRKTEKNLVSPEGIEPSTNRLRDARKRRRDEIRPAIMGLIEARRGRVDAVHTTLFAQHSHKGAAAGTPLVVTTAMALRGAGRYLGPFRASAFCAGERAPGCRSRD